MNWKQDGFDWMNWVLLIHNDTIPKEGLKDFIIIFLHTAWIIHQLSKPTCRKYFKYFLLMGVTQVHKKHTLTRNAKKGKYKKYSMSSPKVSSKHYPSSLQPQKHRRYMKPSSMTFFRFCHKPATPRQVESCCSPYLLISMIDISKWASSSNIVCSSSLATYVSASA